MPHCNRNWHEKWKILSWSILNNKFISSENISRWSNLLNNIALSKLDLSGGVEGGHNISSSDEGQPLDALEVGVLNGHDSSISKQLLGVIVDQLSGRNSLVKYWAGKSSIFKLLLILWQWAVNKQLKDIDKESEKA